MQGFIHKAIIAALTFFLAFSNLTLCAANPAFNAAAGCMGCHQGGLSSMTTDQAVNDELNELKPTTLKKKSRGK